MENLILQNLLEKLKNRFNELNEKTAKDSRINSILSKDPSTWTEEEKAYLEKYGKKQASEQENEGDGDEKQNDDVCIIIFFSNFVS